MAVSIPEREYEIVFESVNPSSRFLLLLLTRVRRTVRKFQKPWKSNSSFWWEHKNERTRILLVSMDDPKEDDSLLVAHNWLVSTLVVSKLNVDLVIELWISSVVANDVTKMMFRGRTATELPIMARHCSWLWL